MIPTVAPDLVQLQADLSEARIDAESAADRCAAIMVKRSHMLQRCVLPLPAYRPRYIDTPAGCMVRED